MIRQQNSSSCAPISFKIRVLSLALVLSVASAVAAARTTTTAIKDHAVVALPRESQVAASGSSSSAETLPNGFWFKLTLAAIIRWGKVTSRVDTINNQTNEFLQTVSSGINDGVSHIIKFSFVMFNCSITSASQYTNSTVKRLNSSDIDIPKFESDEIQDECEDLSIKILKGLKGLVVAIGVAILAALLLPIFLRLFMFIVGFTAYGNFLLEFTVVLCYTIFLNVFVL